MNLCRERLAPILLCTMSLLIALSFSRAAAAAGEKPAWAPEMAGGVTFETKYIWRGQDMVDDPVIQPEASVAKYGITLSYWGNVSMASSQRRWTEHDFTVDYSIPAGRAGDYIGIPRGKGSEWLDRLNLACGNIFYAFPEYSGKNFHSEEFYLGASYDVFLEPWFKWYEDYGRGAGSYLQCGIGRTFDLTNGITAKAGVTVAYNAGQWGYGYKLAPLLVSGEISIPLFRYFTVTPNINYSCALDRSDKDGLAYGSEFYGGVKVGVHSCPG